MRIPVITSKRGDKHVPMGSGAPFIVVLALLIVFYIIFLPPADRAALLNGDTLPGTGDSSTTTTTTNSYSPPVFGTQTLFEQTFKGPGDVVHQPQSSYAHDISTTTLRGAYQAGVLLTANDFIVSRSTLSSKIASFSFPADSPADVRNPILSFGVKNYADAQGVLTIKLNGVEVFSGRLSQFNSAPVNLGAVQLQSTNTITFEVSGPGLAFWQVNEYDITNLKVQADSISRSGLQTEDTFHVDQIEIDNLNNARLRFVPTCGPDSGKLTMAINGHTVFSKIPDCNSANYVTVPKEDLKSGENSISFVADYGLYQLDRIQVQTFLNDNPGVTYYFDLDKSWFTSTDTKNAVCGESDGICPAGCTQDVDRDCCFTAYESSFWCDVPTQVTADRCVGYVDNQTAARCPSGYKDRSGNVPSDFSDSHVCGDNNDGVCPAGCSQLYDKDCCLKSGVGNYFCDQLTVGGVQNMCKLSLSTEEYSLCPDGYIARDGGRLQSTYNFGSVPTPQESTLGSNYIVTAEFTFVDDSKDHTATLNINGFKTNFDTRDARILKDISRYVVSDSNYIQIIPQTDFSLVRVNIKVEKR